MRWEGGEVREDVREGEVGGFEAAVVAGDIGAAALDEELCELQGMSIRR